MCLVLLAFRAHPDMELLLAGNRDEHHGRPSAPPAVIHSNPVIHAGRDLEAGGTWMGRNEWGMMAALTNRHGASMSAPPGVRSRGEIVVSLLKQKYPEQAAAWLGSLERASYRGFNVFFGNARRFFFFASSEQAPPQELSPGYYALSNSTLNDRSWPKVERSLRFLKVHHGTSGEVLLADLARFLGDSTPPDELRGEDPAEEIHGNLGAVFIRSTGYGTVSSTILTAGGRIGERYDFADGASLGKTPEGAFQPVLFSPSRGQNP